MPTKTDKKARKACRQLLAENYFLRKTSIEDVRLGSQYAYAKWSKFKKNKIWEGVNFDSSKESI